MRKRLLAAGILGSVFVANADGAFIGSLNGVSNSSTFENATTTTSPAPIGWTAIGATGIRAYKGTGGTNSMMIAASGNQNNYTAQYDAGTAIVPNTVYTLTSQVGFSTTTPTTFPANGFAILIGEVSGGVFTQLAAYNASATYLYNANATAPYYSASATVQFTTPAAVDGNDVAVQLTRISPDGTNWLGFDNVTLDATPVPEPATVAGLAAVAVIAPRRRRR